MTIGQRAAQDGMANLGVREESPNWGKWVSVYLNFVGWFKPAPWCAAFVAYRVHMAAKALGMKARWPKTASVQAVVNWAKRIGGNRMHPQAGDAIAFYHAELKRYAHIGLIVSIEHRADGIYLHTVEGNTNDEGSREGYEVAARVRRWNPRAMIAIVVQ
jgi:hypothetical protein